MPEGSHETLARGSYHDELQAFAQAMPYHASLFQAFWFQVPRPSLPSAKSSSGPSVKGGGS